MVRGVYRLTCDDPSLNYYGSSDNIYKRQIKHKCDYKKWKNGNIKKYCSSFKLYELGGVEIELVFECPADISRREMEEIEQTYIENDECCNIKRAFMTKEDKKENQLKYLKSEKGQKYLEKHKEYNKQYKLTENGINSNKKAELKNRQSDRYKQYQKEYSKTEKRKEYMKEYMRQYKLKQKTIE